MLSPTLVTPPSASPLTLEAVKLHLRVDGSAEDSQIQICLDAAVAHLDGFTGILGRCLSLQTWSQEYEAGVGDLVLPLTPVDSVNSVTHDEGTFTEFRLLKDARGYFLRLNDGHSWPSGSLIVEFVCGYSDIPSELKSAILLHVGTLFENRETLAEKVKPSMAYEALISPYNVNLV